MVFDPVYGARPLRRLVQQAIGDQAGEACCWPGRSTTATSSRSTFRLGWEGLTSDERRETVWCR